MSGEDDLRARLGAHQRTTAPGGPCLCGKWPVNGREVEDGVDWIDHLMSILATPAEPARESDGVGLRPVVDAVLACLPMSDDGTGHVVDCGYDDEATPTCGCYSLPGRIAEAIEPWLAARVAEAGARALEKAADEMEFVIAEGDVAEVAAPVQGERGRDSVVARRDALYEEPHTWLRDRARDLGGAS